MLKNWLDMLKEQVVSINYKKADGSQRTLKCTLRPDVLREVLGESNVDHYVAAADHGEQVRVIDVEKRQWRSFLRSGVVSYEVLESYTTGGKV